VGSPKAVVTAVTAAANSSGVRSPFVTGVFYLRR
jgi:hypothetical protein